MSGLENSTSRYIRAALVAALLMPGSILAVVAARQSRMMVIIVRDSSDDILETFRSAAIAAGLRCQWLHSVPERPAEHAYLQCSPPKADRYLGLVDVVEVGESKVVISAFSSNVSTPHDELDPAVEAALTGFNHALAGNPKILPDYRSARHRIMIHAPIESHVAATHGGHGP